MCGLKSFWNCDELAIVVAVEPNIPDIEAAVVSICLCCWTIEESTQFWYCSVVGVLLSFEPPKKLFVIYKSDY